jgi:hypothetical protein
MFFSTNLGNAANPEEPEFSAFLQFHPARFNQIGIILT